MVIILKTEAGLTFPLSSGKKIHLQGRAVINVVDDKDFDLIKVEYKDFVEKIIDNGYLVTSKEKVENTKDDLKQEVLDKQKDAIKTNEKANNVKIEKR